MLKFLSLVSLLVVVESTYLGSLGNIGLGASSGGLNGGSGLLGANGIYGAYSSGLNGGAGSLGALSGSLGGGSNAGTSYSYGSISGGTNNLGASSNGGNNAGGNGGLASAVPAVATTVGVSTIPAGPAQTIPTAFSTQSRFDIIHPGSIVQQTVAQVPVVSTQIRPVAVALAHGHGTHH